MKQCKICNKEFNPYRSYQLCCSKECSKQHNTNSRRVYTVNYYNTEKGKETIKKYQQSEKYQNYKKNYIIPEKSQIHRKEYLKSDKFKQNLRNYRKTKKYQDYIKAFRRSEKNKVSQKKYTNSDLGKLTILKHNLKRRSQKNNIIHNFSKEEWIEKCKNTNGFCPLCNNKFDFGIHKLTMDHILAVYWANKYYEVTGNKMVYHIEDIQPICKSCNSSKNIELNKQETILT